MFTNSPFSSANKSFSTDDVVYVSLVQYGVELLNTCLTGVARIADVMGYVRHTLPGVSGLTTLDVRNATGGWTSRQAIYIR